VCSLRISTYTAAWITGIIVCIKEPFIPSPNKGKSQPTTSMVAVVLYGGELGVDAAAVAGSSC